MSKRKVLLCCGPEPEKFCNFDEVWSLGVLGQRRLSYQGISSLNLFDVPLPDLDRSLRLRIEASLEAESARGGKTKWASLVYQRVYGRFVRYYQYRLRLQQLIGDRSIGHLTLSSRNDDDLVHAALATCRTEGIELTLQNGSCDTASNLLSYLAVHDLPNEQTLLDKLFAPLLAHYYRARRFQRFYQPYINLTQRHLDSAVLTWRRSICFSGMTLSELRLSKIRTLSDLDRGVRLDQRHLFDSRLWPDFDSDDLTVLTSAFADFQQRYKTTEIDRLVYSCRAFFRRSRARRLILNSDNTCAARLFSKAAKDEGIHVDYLPHGLIFEGLSLRTGKTFGVDRILAWNSASAANLQQQDSKVELVAHPSNTGAPLYKRRLPNDLSTLRVLIMPPEWVGLSFAGRPDCFERDILDIMEALCFFGIKSAQIKCHNSIKVVLDAKFLMLDAIRPLSPIDFTVIESKVSTQDLYHQFDLAIIGPTTGLLEASRSSTPFIGFRALMNKAGVFDGFQFPKADSPMELIEVIRNYDIDLVNQECFRMAVSLTAGVSPFEKDLDSR